MTRWKRKGDKRKKSSESSEVDSKCLRRGSGSRGPSDGSSEGSSNSQTVGQSVSDIIKEARNTLYNECDRSTIDDVNNSLDSSAILNASVNSVFDKSSVETNMAEKTTTTTTKQSEVDNKPSVSPDQSSLSDMMTLLTAINNKIQKIDKRLDKLESLEKKVDKLETDIKAEINKLWISVNDTCKKLDERVSKVEDSVEANAFVTGETAEKVTQLENECKKAKEDMLYIQSQSMRNNLLFSNIPEEKDETAETTEKILRAFLVEKLQLAQGIVDEIRFERVHRVGHRGRGGKSRSIVAKFNYFKDREEVRRQSNKLKNTDFFINEQFPKDIADRRKKLYPRLMAERKAGRKAWISYDTLYVDGKQVDSVRV